MLFIPIPIKITSISKTSTPDGFPPFYLKIVANSLSIYFTFFLNIDNVVATFITITYMFKKTP